LRKGDRIGGRRAWTEDRMNGCDRVFKLLRVAAVFLFMIVFLGVGPVPEGSEITIEGGGSTRSSQTKTEYLGCTGSVIRKTVYREKQAGAHAGARYRYGFSDGVMSTEVNAGYFRGKTTQRMIDGNGRELWSSDYQKDTRYAACRLGAKYKWIGGSAGVLMASQPAKENGPESHPFGKGRQSMPSWGLWLGNRQAYIFYSSLSGLLTDEGIYSLGFGARGRNIWCSLAYSKYPEGEYGAVSADIPLLDHLFLGASYRMLFTSPDIDLDPFTDVETDSNGYALLFRLTYLSSPYEGDRSSRTDQPSRVGDNPESGYEGPAKVDVNSPDYRSPYTLAVEAYNNEDYEGAAALANEAIAREPSSWEAWLLLGNCRNALKDKTGAIEAYRKSLKQNPGNTYLKEWLDKEDAQK